VLHSDYLTTDDIALIKQVAKREKTFIHAYFDNIVITDEKNQYTDYSIKLTGLPSEVVPDFVERIHKDVPKVLLSSTPEHIEKIQGTLQKEFDTQFEIVRSKPFFLEFTKKGVNKGKSLGLLLERLELTPAQVIACGDSDNDIAMLQFAGLGVAMGNAKPHVKAIADEVTLSNNEDGVAAIVRKYLL
ncbi:MAG: Cof-type HAD-IIB family hydrolase, partial [Bacilli bacterium]